MKRNLFYKTICFWLCFIKQIDIILKAERSPTISRSSRTGSSLAFQSLAPIGVLCKDFESVFNWSVRLPSHSEGGSATKIASDFQTLISNPFSQEENRET
jgi:hypothetical protein